MAQVRALKDALRVDDQRRRARRVLGCAPHPSGAHDQDAESPLVAVVPVSVRGDGGASRGTSSRPCSCRSRTTGKTPLERLRTVTAASASCKGQERAVGYGPMATPLADAVPPALAKPMIQLGRALGRAAQAAAPAT